MNKNIVRTKMLDEAKQQSVGKRPFVEMLIFFLIMTIGSVAQSIILYPAMMYYMYTNENILSLISGGLRFDSQDFIDAMNNFLTNIPEWLVVVNLISTVAIIIACIIYCRFITITLFF